MRDGMELIAVVMGAETSQSRNAACKSLLDYGFANFAVVSPDLSDCDNQIPVRLGKDAGVSAVPEGASNLFLWCFSTISTSKSVPSAAAARENSRPSVVPLKITSFIRPDTPSASPFFRANSA